MKSLFPHKQSDGANHHKRIGPNRLSAYRKYCMQKKEKKQVGFHRCAWIRRTGAKYRLHLSQQRSDFVKCLVAFAQPRAAIPAFGIAEVPAFVVHEVLE